MARDNFAANSSTDSSAVSYSGGEWYCAAASRVIEHRAGHRDPGYKAAPGLVSILTATFACSFTMIIPDDTPASPPKSRNMCELPGSHSLLHSHPPPPAYGAVLSPIQPILPSPTRRSLSSPTRSSHSFVNARFFSAFTIAFLIWGFVTLLTIRPMSWTFRGNVRVCLCPSDYPI